MEAVQIDQTSLRIKQQLCEIGRLSTDVGVAVGRDLD